MLDLVHIFEKFRNNKTALYGLGTESEKALNQLDGFLDIVGLLDSFKEVGELYEKPIISMQQAIVRKVELVIVVARPGSCKAITKKIGDICRENHIALMDIRGKDLLASNKISYDFCHLSGVTKKELAEKIEQSDVISFDLFDTLIMRQTYAPEDVARYVECRLQEKGIFFENFCQRRLQSEKELSKFTAPTLKQIYENLVVMQPEGQKMSAEELADLEWNIDYDLIIPRKEVCNIFKETVSCGKPVYVVSDTYYSKKQLAEILKKCGITAYKDILASNEYKTSKTQNLYSVLLKKEKAEKYLHIGDDIVADIESASRNGLEVCRIYSGGDLLEAAGYLGLEKYSDDLSDRLKIGLFVSNIFNSPFQFEMEDKRITIGDAYNIGYLFCAPMISDFVLWFNRMTEEQNLRNVWYSARDGYLIQKMYRELLKVCGKEDKSIYFLTSRTAAIRAGMQSEEDIQYVDKMKFSGTLEQNLKERFGIDEGDIQTADIEEEQNGLLKYKKSILANAKKELANYEKYVGRLNVEGGNIAFFDFVAKGTTQMYIQRLVKKHLKGLYFLQLEPEYMQDKGLDIQSFYMEKENKVSAIFDNYYILETLLTAPYPSVQGFDEEGEPVYAKETRSDKDIACFERAQDGIMAYFSSYLRLCPKEERKENRKLAEVFLTIIHGMKIMDEDFLNLIVEDPFFNRMTNITDLL